MAPDPYPKIPAKSWYTLKARASASPTTKFSPDAVSAMFGMASAGSARDNIVSPLQRLGLIDENYALTARGQKWRNDSTYAEACDEIIKEIYPEALASLQGADGKPDYAQVLHWMQQKGFGESNAKSMARAYTMIASKDPTSPAPTEPKKAPAAAPTGAATRKRSAPAGNAGTSTSTSVKDAPPPPPPPPVVPGLHIDVQIHIPSDASLEQIDQIFASMAKHLRSTS